MLLQIKGRREGIHLRPAPVAEEPERVGVSVLHDCLSGVERNRPAREHREVVRGVSAAIVVDGDLVILCVERPARAVRFHRVQRHVRRHPDQRRAAGDGRHPDHELRPVTAGPVHDERAVPRRGRAARNAEGVGGRSDERIPGDVGGAAAGIVRQVLHRNLCAAIQRGDAVWLALLEGRDAW
ncbi:MAG: ribonuclease P protein component [Deltaproteobacteria bacterium]|nr:ribonuclease P protein component [Deltaproteobacteria bacterium]